MYIIISIKKEYLIKYISEHQYVLLTEFLTSIIKILFLQYITIEKAIHFNKLSHKCTVCIKCKIKMQLLFL